MGWERRFGREEGRVERKDRFCCSLSKLSEICFHLKISNMQSSKFSSSHSELTLKISVKIIQNCKMLANTDDICIERKGIDNDYIALHN